MNDEIPLVSFYAYTATAQLRILSKQWITALLSTTKQRNVQNVSIKNIT